MMQIRSETMQVAANETSWNTITDIIKIIIKEIKKMDNKSTHDDFFC